MLQYEGQPCGSVVDVVVVDCNVVVVVAGPDPIVMVLVSD